MRLLAVLAVLLLPLPVFAGQKPAVPQEQYADTINRGLLAAWLMTEGGGRTLHDASGSNNAALNGGASWTVGPAGRALLLDGSTGYALAANFASGFANQTFTAFVEFATTSTASGVFLSGGDGLNNGWLFGISTAGAIFFQWKPSNRICVSNTSGLIDGKPHQVLAVVHTDTSVNANNSVQLIIDGAIDSAAASGGTANYTPGTGLYFGRRNGGGSSPLWLAGTLYQARIWRTGMTAADAANLRRDLFAEFRPALFPELVSFHTASGFVNRPLVRPIFTLPGG